MKRSEFLLMLIASISLLSGCINLFGDSSLDEQARLERAYHISVIPINQLESRRNKAMDLVQNRRIHLLKASPAQWDEDPDWGFDPYGDRSWRWALHAFVWVDDLAAASLADGDTALLHFAFDLIDDWMRDNLTTPASDMTWHDHATALRANRIMSLLAVADSLGIRGIESERGIDDLLVLHAEKLMDPGFYTRHTNHGYDQSRSLLLLSRHLDHVDKASWFDVANERISDEINFAFTPDGVHKENSPAYHNHVLSLLFSTREMDDLFRIEGRNLDQLISRALLFSAAIIQPDGNLPMFGDTSGSGSKRFDVPMWVKERDSILFGLTKGAKGVRPAVSDLVLPESGWVIFRDRWHAGGRQGVHLVVKGAALSTYHFHDDIQSLTLWAHGERWIIDPGMFGYYYEDPRRIHMTGRRAHNVVIIDDSDLSITKSVVPTTFVEASGGDRVAECKSVYVTERGVQCTRTVIYRKPDKIIVMDHIESPVGEDLDCRQIFHLDRGKTVRPIRDGFIVESNSENDVVLEIVSPDATSWRCAGQTEPWLQGWASYSPGKFEAVEVVGFVNRGAVVDFKTTLTFK